MTKHRHHSRTTQGQGDSQQNDFGDLPAGRRGRMFEHGRLRLALLQLIAAKPAHGYELIKAIEEKTRGAYCPSPGVVYPTLTLLEELGYVSVAASDGGRKLYTVTAAGQGHLDDNRVALEEMMRRSEMQQRYRSNVALPVQHSMDNLKQALRAHMQQDIVSNELALAIAAALDQATQTIAQLKSLNPSRTTPMTSSTTPRSVQRFRQEGRRRLLTVKRVTSVTPRMVCVTLTGDLEGFNSPAHDDHVKLFFPAPGSIDPILPAGPKGSPEAAAGPTPIMRDYTPRRYDAAANELDIEFVLHNDGPATTWAAQVQPGHTLGVGGPRGSSVLQGDFDWYVLVADESGLPALARRLEELPAGARAFVIAEVEDSSEEQRFTSNATVTVTWVHRQGREAGTPELLLPALRNLSVPAGVGYTWIACESNVARALRNHLTGERGFDKQWLKAAGYWKHGAVASHERHDD